MFKHPRRFLWYIATVELNLNTIWVSIFDDRDYKLSATPQFRQSCSFPILRPDSLTTGEMTVQRNIYLGYFMSTEKEV